MKILLVEDENDVAESIRLYLSQVALPLLVDFHTVETAEAGLAECVTGTYQGMIVDLNLPDSQPGQTVDAFRDAMGTIPTIAISGFAAADVGLMAIEHGAKAFVPKPDLSALKKAFEDLLARMSGG